MALLTLAEAKTQLGIRDTDDDDELTAYIDALTAPIERIVGPVETREVTETIEGKGPSLCLTHIPAVALVSITPALGTGGALDLSSVVLDPAPGIVRRRAGTFAGTLWTVVYSAGRGPVAPTINLAARLLLQHLWRTKNRGSAGIVGGGDDYSVTDPIPGLGYAIPNRVLELLEAYRVPPGVA